MIFFTRPASEESMKLTSRSLISPRKLVQREQRAKDQGQTLSALWSSKKYLGRRKRANDRPTGLTKSGQVKQESPTTTRNIIVFTSFKRFLTIVEMSQVSN